MDNLPAVHQTPPNRNHVLLHLLGDTVPLHARLSTENPVAVPRQSDHRATLLARLAHLGVCKSTFVQGSFYPARNGDGE